MTIKKKPLKPLHPDALKLLPADDESMKCAVHTREHRIDPVGSALDVDLLLLVETPLPWPKPVFTHELLDGLMSTFATEVGAARLLACAPALAAEPTIHLYKRSGPNTQHAELTFASREELHEHVGQISKGGAVFVVRVHHDDVGMRQIF